MKTLSFITGLAIGTASFQAIAGSLRVAVIALTFVVTVGYVRQVLHEVDKH